MESEPPPVEGEPDGDGQAQDDQADTEQVESQAKDASEALLVDDVDVRDLLRRALDDGGGPSRHKAISKGVQRRLREQSRGRYFADGWSTSQSPRGIYLVTTVLMLLVIVLAFILLAPMQFVLP
jgi:hypothetical protein